MYTVGCSGRETKRSFGGVGFFEFNKQSSEHDMRALLHNSAVANLEKSGQNERKVSFSKTDFIKRC
jgi:hypothetical protein